MKTRRLWVAPIAFSAALLALTSTATAEKLVVFKNGKVMLAKSVTEEKEWLKCEFENGNFMSIPRKGVASIEESTLPENARGPVNQLIDGPRGAANMGGGGGGGDVDVPRGAGRGGQAQMEPPPEDDQEAMRRAIEDEAETRKGFAARNRARQQGQQNGFQQQQQQNGFQPIPGLNGVNQVPGMTPITAPSSNLGGKKRAIGRRSDSGNATQLPGQQQPVPNE